VALDPVDRGVEAFDAQPPRPQTYRAGKFLTAADLPEHAGEENAHFKTVLVDARTGKLVVPNGALGHRFGDAGVGRWNLDLGEVDPR
jgi:nitrate reductase alpha subunit